jgi:hypothetical protein
VDAGGREQRGGEERAAAEQQARAPRAQRTRGACDGVAARAGASRAQRRRPRRGRFAPLRIHRDDHARDAGGRTERRGDRVGAVLRERGGRGGAHPADRARERGDVGSERGIRAEVPGGVIADPVDDGRARAPRVVQVREAVGEAGAEVEQGGRGPLGHARIAVRGAGADALEQAQHRSHPDAIERGHERHLGRARVGEAELDPESARRLEQRLRSVHAHLHPTGTGKLPS